MKVTNLTKNIKDGIKIINVVFFIVFIAGVVGIILSFALLTVQNMVLGVLAGLGGILGLVIEYFVYKYIISLGQTNIVLINAINKINSDSLEQDEETIPSNVFEFKKDDNFQGFRLPNSYDVEFNLKDSASHNMSMIFTNYLILKFYETSLDMAFEKQKEYLAALQYDKYLITEEALQNEVNKLLALDDDSRIQGIKDNINFIKESYGFIDHFDKNYHKELHPKLLDHKGHYEIIL